MQWGPAKGGIFQFLYFCKIWKMFFSVFRIFRISSKPNHWYFTNLTKWNIVGPKTSIFRSNSLFLGQKQGFLNIPYIQNIRNMFVLFCIYGIYCIKIKFIFLRKTPSDSNFNQNLITSSELRALICNKDDRKLVQKY